MRLIAAFVLAALALLLGASAASGGGAGLRVVSYIRKEDDSIGVVLRVVAGVKRPCHGHVQRRAHRERLAAVVTNGHGAAQWSWDIAPGVRKAFWHARVLCGRNGRDVDSRRKRFLVEGTRGQRKGRRLMTPPRSEAPPGLRERGAGRADPYSTPRGSAIRLAYERRPDLPDLKDADQWIKQANRMRFPTGSQPLPDAIAWFPPNRNGVGPYGHVAYVTAVNGNMISIEEYDGNPPRVRPRTIPWAGLTFIYRKGELPPSPQQPHPPDSSYDLSGTWLLHLTIPADGPHHYYSTTLGKLDDASCVSELRTPCYGGRLFYMDEANPRCIGRFNAAATTGSSPVISFFATYPNVGGTELYDGRGSKYAVPVRFSGAWSEGLQSGTSRTGVFDFTRCSGLSTPDCPVRPDCSW